MSYRIRFLLPFLLRNRWLILLRVFPLIAAMLSIVLWLATSQAMRTLPSDLNVLTAQAVKSQLLDRSGRPLTITFQNHWNIHDQKRLHDIPEFLQKAFVIAEDKRFYSHAGIDWIARINAVMQNILSLKGVRGASTISEQVVRMIHQRPRTAWSRWVEGWEAKQLETEFDKATIFEFYLNQVPYAAQRRGVVQAARYYFDRDLFTLSQKEMLSLAVLVRAPSRFDLRKSVTKISGRLHLLADRFEANGLLISAAELMNQQLEVSQINDMVDASHFARHVYEKTESNRHLGSHDQAKKNNPSKLVTTLDLSLQSYANTVLEARLKALSGKKVHNAAMIVLDHESNDVLVWAVGNSKRSSGSAFDSVLTKRQPGSTLKPFVYAAAIEKGWSPATLIDDSPLREGVGRGVHEYRNYSNTYYGNISLRNALGNSLNIPAIKAAKYVGLTPLMNKLNLLGLKELDLRSVDYGNGIALGNGEVSLYSMARAYSAIASGGTLRPIRTVKEIIQESSNIPSVDVATGTDLTTITSVFDGEVSSLIGNILSDSDARALEFGRNSLLRMPVQTAVKTGTSNDYRDAWVFGYDHKYVVGVWMGNLDNTPTDKVTGSIGPAAAMRDMFSKLRKNSETKGLFLSPKLKQYRVCMDSASLYDGECASRNEYFLSKREPLKNAPQTQADADIELLEPIDQTELAVDPRIPSDLQQIDFKLSSVEGVERVEWYIDEQRIAINRNARQPWQVERGHHQVEARVFFPNQAEPKRLRASYLVK